MAGAKGFIRELGYMIQRIDDVGAISAFIVQVLVGVAECVDFHE